MISVNSKLRDLFAQPANLYAHSLIRRMVVFFIFFALYMLCLSADFIPEKISLEVGQVSDRDVIAPRTVSYVDSAKTKKLELEVMASVANVYDMDIAVMTKAEEDVKNIFHVAQAVQIDKTLTIEQKKKSSPMNCRLFYPFQW